VTVQVTTGPTAVQGLAVAAGSDVARFELRDGTEDSDPLVLAVRAPAGEARTAVVPEQACSKVRLVRVAGTGAVATVFFR
jgi:hypothetical protein